MTRGAALLLLAASVAACSMLPEGGWVTAADCAAIERGRIRFDDAVAFCIQRERLRRGY